MSFFDGPAIGKRVTRYRKMNGWTMEELADRTSADIAKIGKGVIANIETGRKVDVSVGQLISLASALSIPPVALMIDLEDMSDGQGVVVGGVRARDDALFGWITGAWPIPEHEDDLPAKRDVDRKIDALHDYISAHRRANDGPQSIEEDQQLLDAANAKLAQALSDGVNPEALMLDESTMQRRILESRIIEVAANWRNEDLALKRLRDLGVRVSRSSLLDNNG